MFRLRVDVPGAAGSTTPPQRTRCSFCGISAPSQLGPDLLEGDRGKQTNGVRRQPVALIDVLAIPATCELFDDTGCFPAVGGQHRAEFSAFPVVREALTRTDMARELTTEVVIQAALGEAPKNACARVPNRSPPARRPIAR